jgi:nitrite reductase/ring-hydroxylating ferredoxin subunit/thioredoxin reductase
VARFPVLAFACSDPRFYKMPVFLSEWNLAGQAGVTRYSGNTMSNEEDHGVDLTQWLNVEGVPDGGILAGVVGEDRVLVWRNGNRLKAYNADCPHLGGPLNKGIVAGATIRCPWHHACFDLATGEATAAPAFDSLVEYAVTLDDDRFCVKPAPAKATRGPGPCGDSLGKMAIIGGGAAGFAAADAIRKLGWQGGLTIFSEESQQPYDRTLLTKDYLEGSFGDDRLPIARHSLADLGVDFEGGASVQQIEPSTKRLRLANGDERPYEKLLLATGAAPRRLDVPGGDLPHVMVLRSLQDCRRILEKVTPGARVAVVGGSFIAMEAAASLSGRGLSVDVIAPEEHPLEKVFGRELSDLVLEAHIRNGVRLHLGANVARIEGKGSSCEGESGSRRTFWSSASASSRAFTSPKELGWLWIVESLSIRACRLAIPTFSPQATLPAGLIPILAKPFALNIGWSLSARAKSRPQTCWAKMSSSR